MSVGTGEPAAHSSFHAASRASLLRHIGGALLCVSVLTGCGGLNQAAAPVEDRTPTIGGDPKAPSRSLPRSTARAPANHSASDLPTGDSATGETTRVVRPLPTNDFRFGGSTPRSDGNVDSSAVGATEGGGGDYGRREDLERQEPTGASDTVIAGSPRPPTAVKPSHPAAVAASMSPAVAGLVRAASGFRDAGQYDRASAALERALRIEPRNPTLLHELAKTRCGARRYADCESFALRSNEFRAPSALKRANWRLVATARGQRGDAQGAARAIAAARAVP